MRFVLATPAKKKEKFAEGFFISGLGHGSGVLYEEPDKRMLSFYYARRGDLLVPDDPHWIHAMPDWAKARKAEILARIRMQRMASGFIEYPDEEKKERLLKQYHPSEPKPKIV